MNTVFNPSAIPVNTAGLLIIFTRYPEPGITKTRLIPELGAGEAARLQRKMTEHVLRQALPLRAQRSIQPIVAYAGGDARRMRAWLGDDPLYMTQGCGSIGDRMYNAFRQVNRLGPDQAVIIGSDIPQISTRLLWQAFQRLQCTDLVLGPAEDGGYYLIGMGSKLLPTPPRMLFNDIEWGTANVLTQTLAIADKAGFSRALLDQLRDVDRPEDIEEWTFVAGKTQIPS